MVPAIYTKTPSPNVSSKYVMIPTDEFIPIANEGGWTVFNTGSRKTRNPIKKNFTKHFIAFEPSESWMQNNGMDISATMKRGDGSLSRVGPRLLIYNGHDGLTGISALFGMFEMICANMVITASDMWGKWSFRHTKINPSKILHFFQTVLEASPYIMTIRNTLVDINVTREQSLDLANRVIDLRWNRDHYEVNPEDLIVPRFEQQSKPTAYNTWQTIQHHLIQGSDKVVNKNTGKIRKASKIKNIMLDKSINMGLWLKLTEWLSDLKYTMPPPPKIDVDVY